MNLIDKIWDKNKKYLHTLIAYIGKEIHHIFKRHGGIEVCCLKLMVPGEKGHENNYEWVNDLRDTHREDFNKAKENYVRKLGCRKRIWAECSHCAMPIIGG